MAQLQSTDITGTLTLGTTENTGSAGNLWYDTTSNQLKYSYASGGSIIIGTL